MAFGIQTNFDDTENKNFDILDNTKQEPVKTEPVKTEPEKQTAEQIFEPETSKKEEPLKTEQPVELTEDQIKAYFSNKYPDKTFEKVEDLFKAPEVKEVEKEVNPWEDVMDDEEKAYLTFKRETGRGRKEFEFLNQDFSKSSPLDLAIERVRKDTGLLTLSKEKAISYLESKLNIDLSSEELDTVGEIELNQYAKPYREELEAQKEKYRKPSENVVKKQPPQDMVELPDGSKITKQQYDQFIETRNRYHEDLTKAVNSVTASDFSLEIDDNGDKRKIDFKYDYSNDDKQSMLSDAKDIDATIAKRYKSDKGFSHEGLAKAIWWGEESNQRKVIAAAMQQARAEAIEELLARDNNEIYSPKSFQRTPSSNNGYSTIEEGLGQTRQGFGVKINV